MIRSSPRLNKSMEGSSIFILSPLLRRFRFPQVCLVLEVSGNSPCVAPPEGRTLILIVFPWRVGGSFLVARVQKQN